MNLKHAAALIVLSLTACATHTAKDAKPSSDLDALANNVERDLLPRLLDNGLDYCAEFATTQGEQDQCLGDLEANSILSNQDKARARSSLRSGINRIKAGRVRCGWWQYRCKAEKTELQAGRKP